MKIIDKPPLKIASPCIGVCSTGIGDSVCRGCKRFAHEVIDWNAYTQYEQVAIGNRLTLLLTQVVNARVQFNRPSMLNEFYRRHLSRLPATHTEQTRLYAILKVGAQQLASLEELGCRMRDEYEGLSPVQMRDEIDQNFYLLSCAHYERYFPH